MIHSSYSSVLRHGYGINLVIGGEVTVKDIIKIGLILDATETNKRQTLCTMSYLFRTRNCFQMSVFSKS